MSRFTYKPTIGAKVLYDGEVWVVWSEAPKPGTWWLLPVAENGDLKEVSMTDAVIARTKLIQPYRGK